MTASEDPAQPLIRLIPVLLLKHGLIVRSQTFSVHQAIGNPMSTVARFSDWNVDELVVLDISSEDRHDLRREDLHQAYAGSTVLNVLDAIAPVCRMPLTFGGGVRTIEDIEARLARGADKVLLNGEVQLQPRFLEDAASRFGQQCIVVAIDVRGNATEGYQVVRGNAGIRTDMEPQEWARRVESLGAGEILLTSVDRDGTGEGYDLNLCSTVASEVEISVVLCGGVGAYSDLPVGVLSGGADAVAAANIFHFREISYVQAKQACIDAGLHMRPVELGAPYWSREPTYDRRREDERLSIRLASARRFQEGFAPAIRDRPASRVRWCTRCVYPTLSAAPMEFDQSGVCTGCQMAVVKAAIPSDEWARRRSMLVELTNAYRSQDGSNYDCVIAVSGGKDSYFQVHVLKNELGLNPLLVTYDGNNWTDVGWRNLLRMREVFDVDHVIVRPSVRTLRTLNRLAFYVMGDMNWHAHVGIMTVPMSIAASNGVPLVFYGEHGYLDLSGQFSMNDFPEVTYRDRLEHFARGFEWTYFVGREGLEVQDLLPWRYPTDARIAELDLRGIFLGNYVYWEANEHTSMVIDRYGFEVNSTPFDRTYRLMSNLDDMHENGVHDYLKYIKFGYGRATDHASKDIRAGLMSRDVAIAVVNRYDPVRPGDLQRWLEYVDMSEAEFDAVADTYRDPRVWWWDGAWRRDELRQEPDH